MEVPRSRYKSKQFRKKKPHIRLLLSGSTEDEAFSAFARSKELFEDTAEKMYDSVWPEWRDFRTVQISIRALDEDEMAQINGNYRQIGTPTDVLTFPLFESDGEFIPDKTMFPLVLGDILLCPPVIRKNAAEHGVSVLSELSLVIFHGMLHLLAWDHDTPEKEQRMWAVQERFRDALLQELPGTKASEAGQ